MKQRSFILFVLAVFCIGLMSSCDSDNNGDVRVLTKEEKARALSLTLGEYTTGMTFVLNQLSKPGSKYNKVDTVRNIKCRVANDTTLTIASIPMRALTDFIKDSNLKAALNQVEAQPLVCKINFYDDATICFLITKIQPQTFKVTYGGKQHTVVQNYDVAAPWSWGYYDYKFSKDLFAVVTTGKLTVDGVEVPLQAATIAVNTTPDNIYSVDLLRAKYKQ